MIAVERHSRDAKLLAQEFDNDPQVSVLEEDGYHVLKSHLPPRERRGLVLIDPAYELRDETKRLLQGLADGCRRWPTGIYAIWYPIMPKIAVAQLHRELIASEIRKTMVTELCIYPDDNPLGLNGSGIIIVNPPWKLDEELRTLLPWLWQRLSADGQGRYRVEWLVPE